MEPEHRAHRFFAEHRQPVAAPDVEQLVGHDRPPQGRWCRGERVGKQHDRTAESKRNRLREPLDLRDGCGGADLLLCGGIVRRVDGHVARLVRRRSLSTPTASQSPLAAIPAISVKRASVVHGKSGSTRPGATAVRSGAAVSISPCPAAGVVAAPAMRSTARGSGVTTTVVRRIHGTTRQRQERQPQAEVSRAGWNRNELQQRRDDNHDERDLDRERGEVAEEGRGRHLSPPSSSRSCFTSRRCFGVSLLSRARWTSSASDAPSKTRSRKSRTMPPMTCWLRLRRPVDMRAVVRRLRQVSLLLQDPHHRHHGRVGDGAGFPQRLVDVADGRLVGAPDDFHDGEFLRRERRVWCSHRRGQSDPWSIAIQAISSRSIDSMTMHCRATPW